MARALVYSRAGCSYCDAAKALLKAKGIDFEEIRVDLHPEKLQEMLERSGGRRSFPQIILDGESIGGFDELKLIL